MNTERSLIRVRSAVVWPSRISSVISWTGMAASPNSSWPSRARTASQTWSWLLWRSR